MAYALFDAMTYREEEHVPVGVKRESYSLRGTLSGPELRTCAFTLNDSTVNLPQSVTSLVRNLMLKHQTGELLVWVNLKPTKDYRRLLKVEYEARMLDYDVVLWFVKRPKRLRGRMVLCGGGVATYLGVWPGNPLTIYLTLRSRQHGF